MPIIHVNVWEGFGAEKSKAVIHGITNVFTDLGVPQHAVEVIVHEVPKSHLGIGGEPASERFKDESLPGQWRVRMGNKLFYQHYDPGESPPAGEFSYCPFCRGALIRRDAGGKPRRACPDCGFVQYISPSATVSVLVVDAGQVLLGKRLAEPGRGQWSLPAGYIEFDDDLVGAGVREVKEETGLEVEITSVFNVIVSFLSPRYHFLTVFLVGHVAGGELRAADDLEEVGWFPLVGPFPEMAFQEDVDVIARFAAGEWQGIPVAHRTASL